MSKSFADVIAAEQLPPEFWRELALALLRRCEHREPGFADTVRPRLSEAEYNAKFLGKIIQLENDPLSSEQPVPRWSALFHGYLVSISGDDDYARWLIKQQGYQKTIKTLRDACTKDLTYFRNELPMLKVDRRRLKADPWPVPRPLLALEYRRIRLYIQEVKKSLKQQGYEATARRIWEALDLGLFGVPLQQHLKRMGKNPAQFWREALLCGVYRNRSFGPPDDATMDDLIDECKSAAPGHAASYILEKACTIKDPKTGKLSRLSAAKIRQYASRYSPTRHDAYNWKESEEWFKSRFREKAD